MMELARKWLACYSVTLSSGALWHDLLVQVQAGCILANDIRRQLLLVMKSKLLYASSDLVVEMKENLYIKIAFTEVEIAYRLDLSSYQNVIKIKLPLPFYCETFANLDCFSVKSTWLLKYPFRAWTSNICYTLNFCLRLKSILLTEYSQKILKC